MPLPTYNAAPLSKTFLLLRLLTLLSLIPIIGLTAHLISQVIATNTVPPREIVAMLAISSLTTLYTLLSLPLFLSPSPSSISLLLLSAFDFLLLITYTILSILLGRSLAYISCPAVPKRGEGWVLVQGQRLKLGGWASSDRGVCWEVKASWGLGIAVGVGVLGTGVLLPVLWLKNKRGGGGKGAA